MDCAKIILSFCNILLFYIEKDKLPENGSNYNCAKERKYNYL